MSEKRHPTAFISHAGEDKERFVRPFAVALWEKHKVKAWVDEWEINPGDKFAEKIYAAIDKADAVVVILSDKSADSQWVREEIDAAVVRKINEGAKVLPVVLDGLSKERIPPALHSIHQVRVEAKEHARAAEEINRGIRGLPNPRQPTLGGEGGGLFSVQSARVVIPAFKLGIILQMAESGDAKAQSALGVMYHEGEGIPQNDAEAEKWTRRAAEQGMAVAQFNLGQAYYQGQGVPQNDAEAAEWWRHAAKQGNAIAQFNLGQAYYQGQGVPQNDAEAAEWWRHAAKQGNAKAQYNLSIAYHRGEGVVQDDVEAAKWTRCAAKQGLVEAQYNLGIAYSRGEGVAQDDVEAAKWYRSAAEQGDAKAQCNIGGMYGTGEGVPQSHQEAYIWFSIAAAGGDLKAPKNKEKAAKHLSAEDLAAAQNEAVRRHEEIRRKQEERAEKGK